MTNTQRKRPLPALRSLVSSAAGRLNTTVRGVGFWTAILLPVLYIPLMLISHPWVVDLANLTKVLALHAASLLVGNGYGAGAE